MLREGQILFSSVPRLWDLIPVNSQIPEVRMKERKFYLYIEGKRIKVSEEVYKEYYKGERKERYFMKDLKAERVTIDPQTGKVTVMPGREDSYERLMERHRQFASYGSMEEETVRSLLLEQALRKLTGRELFPCQIFCPVKQDDIKGTSGNPEGL